MYADRAGDPGVPAIGEMIDEKAVAVGGWAYHAGVGLVALAIACGSAARGHGRRRGRPLRRRIPYLTFFRVWAPTLGAQV